MSVRHKYTNNIGGQDARFPSYPTNKRGDPYTKLENTLGVDLTLDRQVFQDALSKKL